MTSKQRAFLRKQANTMEPIAQIGKNGIDDNQLDGINDALIARELIKITVHESFELTARQVSDILVRKLKAEPIQVIGRRIVIYKRNDKLRKYGV